MTLTQIGVDIRAARERAGLSLSGLGERMSAVGRPTSKALLHYWEKGSRRPHRADVQAIAAVLDLGSEWAEAAACAAERSRDRLLRAPHQQAAA